MVRFSRLKPIAAILGLCVFASLAFALVFNDVDEQASEAIARPQPSSTPSTPRQTPPPLVTATPAPTPLVIPESAEALRLLRAGETCTIREPETNRKVATFIIPSSMVTLNCRTISWATRPAPIEHRLIVEFEPASGLASHFDASPEAWRKSQSVAYAPTQQAPAWRVFYEMSDRRLGDHLVHLIDVRAAGSDDTGPKRPGLLSVTAGSPNDPEVVDRLDELVASIDLANPPTVPNPVPGGYCSGEYWVLEVPATWFSTENCRNVNTSSQDRLALQCDCVAPVQVLELTWSQPLLSPIVRDDGLRYAIDERRSGDEITERTVIIEMPSRSLVIKATARPDHALIGHTWEDTLAAQDAMLASLRQHSVDCADDPGARYRLASDVEGVFLQRQPQVVRSTEARLIDQVPVTGTGCAAEGWREVQLDGDVSRIGWVQSADLEPIVEVKCSSSDGVLVPADFLQDGDFDGDGSIERAELRVFERTVPTGAPNWPDGARPIELTVPLGDGTAASGVLDGVIGFTGQRVTASDLRPVGVDRNVVVIQDDLQQASAGGTVFFVVIDDCRPKIIGSVPQLWGRNGALDGYCTASTPFGDVIRAFELESSVLFGHEGVRGMTSDRHLVFDGTELVDVADWQWDVLGVEAPVCGTEFKPLIDARNGAQPGPMSGTYDFVASFGDGESSFARLELVALDSGEYRIDFGPSFGRKIFMRGVMREARNNTLESDGLLDMNAGGQYCAVEGRPSWVRVGVDAGWSLSAPECDVELTFTRRVDTVLADPCNAAPLDPAEPWTYSINADVDDDGRDDAVKLRPGWEIVDNSVTSVEVAVVLDAGPVRRATLAPDQANLWLQADGGGLDVVQIIGLDRDLLLFTSNFGAFSSSFLVDLAACEPTVLARLRLGFRGIGWCRVDTGEGTLFRSYNVNDGSDEHLVWGGNGLVDALPDGFDDPACGPVVDG